ncbi:hypothetical protein HMPREF0077_1557 [Anaerococcus tetradius ATCC 35098]|uniref:Uncharacterized protein n=1 Tax=Anaerococcus tetradius ATCC 35098 TaxID=525255 RepID=C2CJ97_9FIRM|nr:hypothetical protein HMPREF0077_1557 [Anaerococcus tetradius ATCC 35098]
MINLFIYIPCYKGNIKKQDDTEIDWGIYNKSFNKQAIENV